MRRSSRRSGPRWPPGCRWASAPWPAARPVPSIAPPFMGMPMTGRVVLAAKAPARCAAMPAAHRMTPKPLSLALLAKVRRLSRGAVGRKDVRLKGDAQRLELAAGALYHRPITVRTHDHSNFTNHIPKPLFLFPVSTQTKKAVVCLHHGLLLLRNLQSVPTQSYTGSLHCTRTRTTNDLMQHFQHSVTPPNFYGKLTFPSSANGAADPHRPSDRYSLRQNIRFAKGVWAISPLCSLAPKNFQKFCAVSTLIFFLSMTYL